MLEIISRFLWYIHKYFFFIQLFVCPLYARVTEFSLKCLKKKIFLCSKLKNNSTSVSLEIGKKCLKSKVFRDLWLWFTDLILFDLSRPIISFQNSSLQVCLLAEVWPEDTPKLMLKKMAAFLSIFSFAV